MGLVCAGSIQIQFVCTYIQKTASRIVGPEAGVSIPFANLNASRSASFLRFNMFAAIRTSIGVEFPHSDFSQVTSIAAKSGLIAGWTNAATIPPLAATPDFVSGIVPIWLAIRAQVIGTASALSRMVQAHRQFSSSNCGRRSAGLETYPEAVVVHSAIAIESDFVPRFRSPRFHWRVLPVGIRNCVAVNRQSVIDSRL